MSKLASFLVALVAIEHLGFLVLEMFLWTTPTGMQVFGTTPDFAGQSAALAANQGLYNGFLAAGLLWGLVRKHDAFAIKLFFLTCVVVAGIFGAVTVKTSIFFVQAVPALLALMFVIAARK
jgi:putative membrane protein